MRYLNRMVWAMVVVAATTATGSAQQGTFITQGGQTTTGSLSGTGGLTGGQAGQLSGGQGGMGGSQLGGTDLQQIETAPEINKITSTGSSLATTNIFSGFYANPLYQGSTWDLSKTATPGGFGQALGGGSTGAGGRTGGLGTQRTGGLGGLGTQRGGLNTATQSGTVIPMQVNFSYAAVPRFAAPALTAPQIQADVSGMFARSTSMIPGAANVQVLANGSEVTLRGTVSDVEEARTIEGMARLTPGVRSVKNELTFPVQR